MFTPGPALTRRTLLQACSSVAGGLLLPACAAQSTVPASPHAPRLRLLAPSGYLPDPQRIGIGLQRLQRAGFVLDNTAALGRRHLRFAGTDAERAADLQEVAAGRVPTPQVLLGARGGYGAIRLLPLIDWAALGSRMREAGTLFLGYSDVCALQLALLAQGRTGSLAGPMFYSEFGSPWPSAFALQQFVQTVTSTRHAIEVPVPTSRALQLEGVFWGGNLSVLAALAGSPWMPQVPGGILFIEDVGEQPYRLERMLQTLHLSGVLKQQQAIVLGSFRIRNEEDGYDASYDFDSVIGVLRQITGLPVLTGFPFGHIRDKVTMPLGWPTRLQTTAQGYRLVFSGYPRLEARHLQLHTLSDPVSVAPVTSAADDDSA